MARFLDPELFPRDLIADYFQSVAPLGYTALYRGDHKPGRRALVVNKILPIALGLVTTVFCFGGLHKIAACSLCGLSPVAINGSLWMEDDGIVHSESFSLPAVFGIRLLSLRRSLVSCLIALALEGCFIPRSFSSRQVCFCSRWCE